MKKLLITLFASVVLAGSFFALEVDEKELKTTGRDTIEFINYSGPHKVVDSADSIKRIGSDMGKTISPTVASNAGNREKYYVVHAVDANESGKLDADILFIGKEATVDHVNNLRRIIAGYLSAAYGYSEKDANTLAVFITVYNAVYRGDINTYKSKYKDVVTKNLSSGSCGLSTNYKDWPGNSQIVIPLFDVSDGGLSTVDTSVISDSKVVDSMQEDDDKNIDSRKDMVDLKEREAEAAEEKAQEAQKEAVQQEKELNEAKKEAEEAQKEAEEARKNADENPDDEEAQKTAEEAEKKAEEAQKEVDEQQKKVDEAKDEAAEKQALADRKQTEAQNERKEIAKDQQEVQQKEKEAAKMPSEYGIIIVDEKELLSEIIKFNTENGDIIKKSPVKVIRNRTIYAADNEQFIAVAGDDSGNGTIKLVLIDMENMEISKESNETLSKNSVLVQDGSNFYCVIDDNGKWVVAKYDSNLSLKLKSPVAVKETTPITVQKSGVVVTDSNGQLRLLSLYDLSSITKESSINTDAK